MTSFKRLESDRAKELNAHRLAAKKEAEAQGGSCLSCRFTKLAYGKVLFCNKKDKCVKQYNICHFWELKK